MDINAIVKELLGNKSTQWTGMLTKLGFSGPEASGFLSNLLEQVGGMVKGGTIELSKGLEPKRIMDKLDVGALSKKVGIDAPKAQKGLDAVLPDLAKSFQSELGKEGLLAKAGGKIGKLFGK